MHKSVSYNLKIVGADHSAVISTSSAALYGKGIFTTLAILDGKPFVWEKHWRRLTNNAEKLKIDLAAYSEQTTRDALDELIRTNQAMSGRARITFFDESPDTIWPFKTNRTTSLLITTGDLRAGPKDVRLALSQYQIDSTSPLAGIKSCNYLDKILTLDEAKERGFDEAVQVNERGHVTSAVMANVFWLKRDVLYTPSLTTGCLTGTTREFVLENTECREVEAAIGVLQKADAIFITSAGIGIVRVAQFEGRRLTDTGHPIQDLWPV